MTAGEAFRQYTSLFKDHDIADAADEARVLVCYILGISSAWFFAQPDRALTAGEQSALEALVERRLQGEPSAYLTNHREFFGIDLYVDRRVLIPRPETETLVEAALEYALSNSGWALRIVDVGTGSGAIAVALGLNLPEAVIYATDVSQEALEVAARNVLQYGLQDRVSLLQGDLLLPLPGQADLVVANLPYIAAGELPGLQVEVQRYEPGIALDGGESGTALIARLLGQVRGRVRPGGAVLLEIGQGQEVEVFNLVKSILPGCSVSALKDLAGIKRVAKIGISTFDIDE